MKKIFSFVLALVMLFVFTACGDNTPDEPDKPEKTKITVCLDWTPNTNHTGLYVALDKGYFDASDLDVEIVQPDLEMAPQVVGSGKAQFGIDAQDTMAAALIGEGKIGITAVAAIIQHNTSAIMSLKTDNIVTPKDMSGKKYSTYDSPIEQAIIKKIVNDDGGDFDSIVMIPNTYTDEGAVLSADETDSIWIYHAWGGINAERQGYDVNYLEIADYDKELDYYTPVIIANDKFIGENPDVTLEFMQAVKKGYEYAAKHPEEAAEILLKLVPDIGDPDFIKESQAYISTKYIDDADSWGKIDQERWDSFYSWLNENNLVEEELKPGQGFTNKFLG